MALTKNPNRQEVLVATCDFVFGDLVSGVFAPMIDLPLNAVVIDGALFVTTLFNSATTDQFSIGDKVGIAAASVSTYAALTADITAVGRAALAIATGVKVTAGDTTVGVVWTGVGGGITAGVGRLVIEYMIEGNSEGTYEH